jgi:hypothetical protein
MIFRDNYNPKELHNIINSIDNDTIILSFMDKSYISISEVFLKEISKFDYDNLVVICLDEESRDHLKELGITAMMTPYSVKHKNKFWYNRFLLMEYIFTYFRKNILHTDIDCIWFKDMQALVKGQDFDFMISTAHGHPIDIQDQFGFLGCMGLFFCNYSDRTVDFFKNARNFRSDENINTDQVMMNNYLFNSFSELGKCEHGIIDRWMKIDKLKIGFISEDIARRSYQKNLYCYHPARHTEPIPEFLESLKEKCNDNSQA